ncbi:transposase-like protein [Micromonospora ureilytica]|uniref:Transposase-like protein n=1 Tax=Micromonospora ureilytica TaxID=709868 RepID=A0ABS0JD72_9ACTN|nr:transposase-like protein [Micromonospora ureilytica]
MRSVVFGVVGMHGGLSGVHQRELKHDIRSIYTAVNATAARAVSDDFADKWGDRYPAAD